VDAAPGRQIEDTRGGGMGGGVRTGNGLQAICFGMAWRNSDIYDSFEII
jgi:hypothetical protein